MSGIGGYRVTLSGTLCGQFVENVVYFSATTAPGNVDQTTVDLLDAVDTFFIPPYLDILPSLFQGLAYSAEGVTPAGGPRIFANADWGGVNGSRSGAIVDSGTSPVILSTVTGGPRVLTGKIFVPGVSVTDLANNIYDSGFQAVCATFSGALLTDMTGGASTFRYCIFSKASNAINIPTYSQLSLNPGTQRRRMRPLL